MNKYISNHLETNQDPTKIISQSDLQIIKKFEYINSSMFHRDHTSELMNVYFDEGRTDKDKFDRDTSKHMGKIASIAKRAGFRFDRSIGDLLATSYSVSPSIDIYDAIAHKYDSKRKQAVVYRCSHETFVLQVGKTLTKLRIHDIADAFVKLYDLESWFWNSKYTDVFLQQLPLLSDMIKSECDSMIITNGYITSKELKTIRNQYKDIVGDDVFKTIKVSDIKVDYITMKKQYINGKQITIFKLKESI